MLAFAFEDFLIVLNECDLRLHAKGMLVSWVAIDVPMTGDTV